LRDDLTAESVTAAIKAAGGLIDDAKYSLSTSGKPALVSKPSLLRCLRYALSVYDEMPFEWDDTKSRRNLLERGFGFDHAATIFIGPTIESEDNRRDYGEILIQAIGNAGDDILSVVYSDRGNFRRIISARLANRKERKLWHTFIEHWNKSAE
jgi:uncharacterized protein